MDDVDRGNDHAEKLLSHYIAKIRRRAAAGQQPTGLCLYCEEPCAGRMFCSPECRDDHEHEQRLRARSRD